LVLATSTLERKIDGWIEKAIEIEIKIEIEIEREEWRWRWRYPKEV